MTKELTIDEIKPVKQGVNPKGEAWTLCEVIAQGNRYSTFLDLTQALGNPYWFEIEERKSQTINKKTGEPFVNYTIKAYAPKKTLSVDKLLPPRLEMRLEALEKAVFGENSPL